jgi:Fic family protein
VADEPPFSITPRILTLVGELERLLGRVEAWDGAAPEPRLRKQSRVRTVRGSVGIEGNELTEAQVTAVLEGKRVVGSPAAIREVTNANEAYERAPSWKSTRERDFLAAHRVLMSGLTDPIGRYRHTNVGVLHGTRVAHMAPPAKRVPAQMKALFSWMRTTSTPPLVRGCVAHYEILFVHPFTDGNGRIARLWQHVIMLEASALFHIVPVGDPRPGLLTGRAKLGPSGRRGLAFDRVERGVLRGLWGGSEGETRGEPARAARGSMSGGLRCGPRTERVRRG